MSDGLQLLEQSKEEENYTLLIMQLNKDFLRAGLQETFSAETKPEMLLRNLEAALYEQIISDFEGYLTLLYTIDVSESKIKALPAMQVHELTQRVSVLILERELLKISFKNKSE